MSGSSPLPEAVTASTGTGVVFDQMVLLAVGLHPLGDRVRVAHLGAIGVGLVDGVALLVDDRSARLVGLLDREARGDEPGVVGP